LCFQQVSEQSLTAVDVDFTLCRSADEIQSIFDTNLASVFGGSNGHHDEVELQDDSANKKPKSLKKVTVVTPAELDSTRESTSAKSNKKKRT
jgi:hypothetical protein